MDTFLYEQIEEEYKDDIVKVMRYLWFLWIAGFSSLPILVVISFILGDKLRQNTAGRDISFDNFIIIFIFVAIGSQFAAVFFRKLFLSGKMNNYFRGVMRLNSGESFNLELCKGGLYFPVVISVVPAYLGFLI